jgi:hypothetical protein
VPTFRDQKWRLPAEAKSVFSPRAPAFCCFWSLRSKERPRLSWLFWSSGLLNINLFVVLLCRFLLRRPRIPYCCSASSGFFGDAIHVDLINGDDTWFTEIPGFLAEMFFVVALPALG